MISATLLSLSLATLSTAFDCNIPPVYIDIHKRAVHGTEDFEYGLFMGLGTGPQNQSMWPSISQNETTIADSSICQNLDIPSRETSTGGLFEANLSSTWTLDKGYTSNDIDNGGSFGRDVFHLYTHYFETDPADESQLPNFPFHLLDNATYLPEVAHLVTDGSSTPSTVGLGPTSTLLQALWNTGQIASRSFGLYMGTGYDRAGGVINGSLTLGGYDAGRFNGTVYNYTINATSPTPLAVHVGDLILNDPENGIENYNLIRGTGFDAAITTEQYPLSLPDDVTAAFVHALSAIPSNNSDNSLQPPKPFTGNLTIGLEGGLSVTFPSEWVANISNLSPIAASPTNTSSDGPYYLGSAFLSQIYLMLNYDDDTFHLAHAVPEADYVITKTMCPHVVPTPYTHKQASYFLRNGLAGAVVGGIVGGIALSILGLCLWKGSAGKRRNQVRFFKGREGRVKVVEFGDSDLEDVLPASGDSKGKDRAWGGGDHELPFWKKKSTGGRSPADLTS